MKALVIIILSHSRSPFLPLNYMDKMNFCEYMFGLLEYFHVKKTPPRLLDASHMTMTTSGQI